LAFFLIPEREGIHFQTLRGNVQPAGLGRGGRIPRRYLDQINREPVVYAWTYTIGEAA
jgi:hypothetical protein